MARCSNCNAPLPAGSQLCEYCRSRTDIDLKGIHYYTTHANDMDRLCPRCNIKLKTIDLKINGTFLIERCEECLGFFFDPNELEALLDATVSNVFKIDRSGLDSINLRRQAEQRPVSYLKCPVCSQLMHRVNFGAKSGVIVNHCKNHGLWLDGGDLRHLMEWMKLGGQLLEKERQEQKKLEELKQENDRREKLSRMPAEPTSFGSYSDPLRMDDPDLFDIIYKAIRIFMK